MTKPKNLYKYYSKKKRDHWEAWGDLHNHKLEIFRTITSLIGICINCIVLLKLFKVI